MSRCETCNGEGFCIEFRRFAGEYQAGEPYEIPCPDCDGEDEALCLCCESPLDANGFCEACEESGLAPVEHLEPRDGWNRRAA